MVLPFALLTCRTSIVDAPCVWGFKPHVFQLSAIYLFEVHSRRAQTPFLFSTLGILESHLVFQVEHLLTKVKRVFVGFFVLVRSGVIRGHHRF